MVTRESWLPEKYRILPEISDLRLPGFSRYDPLGVQTLSPACIATADWFEQFVTRVEQAIGRNYLPVCRFADGEYKLALGEQAMDVRCRRSVRFKHRLVQVWNWMRRTEFVARTRPMVSSGDYSRAEAAQLRRHYGAWCREIGTNGILALDLSFLTTNRHGPYHQERFFPALRRWLETQQIRLEVANYVPFYFVYAALLGPAARRLLHGRRVAIFHGATGSRQELIRAALEAMGARIALWYPISSNRAGFDQLDVPALVNLDCELALVGAGVGKPNILTQLRPLGVPCLDAGYAFEVWTDPTCARHRMFCEPDESADAKAGENRK